MILGKPLDNGKANGAAETMVERHKKPIKEADAMLESIMSTD